MVYLHTKQKKEKFPIWIMLKGTWGKMDLFISIILSIILFLTTKGIFLEVKISYSLIPRKMITTFKKMIFFLIKLFSDN